MSLNDTGGGPKDRFYWMQALALANGRMGNSIQNETGNRRDRPR